MYSFTTPSHEGWNDALSHFPEANLLQSWQWGEANTELGHRVIRQIITANDGSVIGAYSCIVKDAKRGRYLEIPGGPLLDWKNQKLVETAVVQLRTLARKHNCVFIRLRTQLPDVPEHHEIMQKIYAKPSLIHVTADHTAIVNLARSEADLLAAMRQQTRYEIRRSKKREISVERVDPIKYIETFHNMQTETAKRQQFYAPSLQYLETICKAFGDDAHMYRAAKHDTLLNLALVLRFGGEVAYFEAASTADARKEPGAYAIIWRIMQDAKKQNIATLNLWGTAPLHATRHRYAGVTTFKRGFGGRDVAYLPAHDIVLQPGRYAITRAIEWARKKRRHL